MNGPMVMSGYINREPIHGDFNTDDMGYVDEDGFLYILNRRTDLIYFWRREYLSEGN